jgi:oligopeptide transport system ATP-binding protein
MMLDIINAWCSMFSEKPRTTWLRLKAPLSRLWSRSRRRPHRRCGPGHSDRSAGNRRVSTAAEVPILEVEDLRKWYLVGGGLFGHGQQQLRAVDGVSFALQGGEVLSLVGESGSGKNTVGRTVPRPTGPTGGSIRFEGRDISTLSRRALRPLRQRMQMAFQGPLASLNPRMTVEDIVAAPLSIHGLGNRAERRERVAEMLRLVGLQLHHAERHPHELSGGQRQRVGIARALVLRPSLLVADEPVSALDFSIQAQVVNLLLELKAIMGLALLFIAHDLAVVGHISDRMAVMYLARLMEIADTRSCSPIRTTPTPRCCSRRRRSPTRHCGASGSSCRATFSRRWTRRPVVPSAAAVMPCPPAPPQCRRCASRHPATCPPASATTCCCRLRFPDAPTALRALTMSPPVDRITGDDRPPGHADVVVIGGGIVGVAAAYALVRKGHSVALVEKGHVGCEQPSRIWGWCRQQGRDRHEIPLARESLRMWGDLHEEIGADPGFRREGVMWVTKSPRNWPAGNVGPIPRARCRSIPTCSAPPR